MSQKIEDVWKQRLESKKAETMRPAVERTFGGLPCRVHPASITAFVFSRRLPDHISARLVGAILQPGKAGPEAELTASQVIEGEKFREWLICTHVAEPRIVPHGAEVGPGAFAFSYLMETEPDFVVECFEWFMGGCPDIPIPAAGGGEVTAKDLGSFPDERKGRGGARARTRRKADRGEPGADSVRDK